MRSLWLALAAPLMAGTADSFLLRHATIHPVSGPRIAAGSVLVKDGRIAGVGVKLTAPSGVRVIDAKGLHVYPGLINSATSLGLAEISSVRETVDTTELGDFNPHLRPLIAINPASEHIPVTRANGITSAIVLPAGGILAGQVALIHLDGWTWEEMGVKGDAAVRLNFPVARPTVPRFGPAPPAAPGDARRRYEERLRALREFFEQARRYQQARRSGAKMDLDLRLEAMLPVLEGKVPLMVEAVRERAILEALEFAGQQKVRLILAGVRKPGKALAEIASRKIPVILGGTLELPLDEDDPYDAAFTLPAELHQAGVKFAFGTFDVQFARNLPFQAAQAVAFGLPYEQGLKAITLNAAEIWGVAGEIGSIEEGKLANLMVTDGDPLEIRTQVKQLFIRGKPVDLDNRQYRLYQKYLNRP